MCLRILVNYLLQTVKRDWLITIQHLKVFPFQKFRMVLSRALEWLPISKILTGKLKENNMTNGSVLIPLEVFKEFLDTIRINFGPLAKKNKDARIAIQNVKDKAEYISAQIGCDFQEFGSWPADCAQEEQEQQQQIGHSLNFAVA